ncbi:MAG: molybdopterin molybdotransferase MoeA, partial [Alphaproteobacteria bacterium]|nr:molybdopterin molybdotransferase MoeA [Alphaproteobacteria bacterium]
MIPFAEALDTVLSGMKTVCSEQVALPDALGRVLARDVLARITQPWADVSSMDGYALKAGDIAECPVTLEVVGESAAGGCYDGELTTGQAVRIFTGAPVPKGADCVVMQENTLRGDLTVEIQKSAPEGNFIRRAGQDFKNGEGLLKAGRILTARDLGLAAAANVPWLMVRRKPRVAVIATGDEVVMPGDGLGANQILSSNSVMLVAFLKAAGAEPMDLGIARDDHISLKRIMDSAPQADLVVTIGGASVGDYGLVNQVLNEQGVDLGFYKVAMRPGKPLIFGTLNGTPVLGLPGNPVSAGVTGALFIRPAI